MHESKGRNRPASKVVPAPAKVTFATPADAAEAAKIMSDVWKNEESRFSNLNTRGAAILSAASLVTTVLGIFTKNILDSTASSLNGTPRDVALVAVSVALGLLLVSIGTIVFGVLQPSGRFIFGANTLTKGGTINAQQADEAAFEDYGAIYAELASRSCRKAYWLTVAYYVFFAALLVSAAATIYIVVAYKVAPQT
jgi:hypothetical protein